MNNIITKQILFEPYYFQMKMSNSDHCVQNKLGSVIKRNHTAIYHKAFDIWSEVLVFIAT